MYFQIENTPEHIRRARREDKVPKESPKEECPRLILAPFSKPPQMNFENVLIGTSCEKTLKVINPLKQNQKIILEKALPPGLCLLPGEWMEVKAESCYKLTVMWTPTQPTAMRETIRFTNESRGRYNVNIVLKSAMNIKGKNYQAKCFKTSPGKMKKKKVRQKKSPVAIYKRKAAKVGKSVRMVQPVQHNADQTYDEVYQTYDKENYDRHDYTMDSNQAKCPFDSPSNLNIDTSEMVSNMKKTKILQETYDKFYDFIKTEPNMPQNVLKPSNKQSCDSSSKDISDNLTFTQGNAAKVDRLDTSNKEYQPLSIMTVNHTYIENNCTEISTIPIKKHPNTSSPKDMNSPNFSINTDFSRISDLSFDPQRHTTERKCFPKVNETHELLNDRLSSDTYTKDSPNIPEEYNNHPYQDMEKPPRSITLPLQSIPEESAQYSHTQKTVNQMATFTIDRTFDKTHDKSSNNTRETWSKKNVRTEPHVWKVPAEKTLKPKPVSKPNDSRDSKIAKLTFETNKSISLNLTANQIGNVYSQTSIVDPFLPATYFYDEEAVHRLENEFKRWLNCILTPPADLDSNVELKIDVGKVWIESRKKEVPLAPTKEQVSNTYHDSNRLESLRRSAKNLFLTIDTTEVFLKLNAQIEKNLIAIRTDRNLHMDVGLQKIIMEIILSYNPLWLRIGLEAIYGIILPLRSNSDIEGLTKFIIQRMFRNPYLKNKKFNSSLPNMLLPAYMEAIKKFTLKKFFMLVFFLDQAKQRKLISHDPCLFRRNAVCKESREILIRFTRELIAGIGDITRHLRPLGYVVSHKQSYLDEYKYAVHNLALDIRDGVRLTKVMEIIMMKNCLLQQLRTPAISRLQKIHNVQVAMNALKEANFVIDGEITAADIADGHREKTLSLLWQIIHVFRAPLFMKAANVIQTWWRKKYQVIVEKRQEEEKLRLRLTNAASLIQHWWRTIQYNRQVELRMQQVTTATTVIQKYCRMWLCRTRLRRFKTSVLKIEEWFKSVKLVREAKNTLSRLRVEREQLRHKCATTIQSQVRRWLCMKHFKVTIQKIVKIQSSVRRFLVRRQYCKLRKSVSYVQEIYRGKLLMRKEMYKFAEQRKSAIKIQSAFRMMIEMRNVRTQYLTLRSTIIMIQRRFREKQLALSIRQTRLIRCEFLQKKMIMTKIQAVARGYLVRKEVQAKKEHILKVRELQRRNWAASKIQALCRGNQVRVQNTDSRVAELRRRWREGALEPKGQTLAERNREAIDAMTDFRDIRDVIRSFRAIELLSEVSPMTYDHNAAAIVRFVFPFLEFANRSISSTEVLKSAAMFMINLARHKATGPKIYSREHISLILKIMWRFSLGMNNEKQVLCRFATYLYLCSKYDNIREDLTEFLHIPENRKIMTTIQGNTDRLERMQKVLRNSHCFPCLNFAIPDLDPDYGINRANKLRYFEDVHQAIHSLFHTYDL